MLAGLAMKRRWQAARRAAGKPIDRPNLVMSSAVQVCWEKFANYFDVEPRYVPITDEHPVFDGHELERYVDENTIGVVAIMGVTYTGAYEPVAQIAGALDRIQLASGIDVPIHVDAALRRIRRALPATRPGLGLPRPAGGLDQRQRPQVRPGLPRRRLGGVARGRRRPQGHDLHRRLPRRRDAHPGHQLLPPRRPSAAAVLQLPAPRLRRLHRSSASQPGRRPLPLRRDRQDARLRTSQRRRRHPRPSPGASAPATPTNGTCTTCPTSCANAAGWCRPTHCPTTSPTAPCSASSSATGCRWTWPNDSWVPSATPCTTWTAVRADAQEGRQHGAYHH